MMDPHIKGDSVKQEDLGSGRILKAPENFLSREGIKTVFAEAKNGRRSLIRSAFAAAVAGAADKAASAILGLCKHCLDAFAA
jgi:sulfane dehydrogenase subunit SoxC